MQCLYHSSCNQTMSRQPFNTLYQSIVSVQCLYSYNVLANQTMSRRCISAVCTLWIHLIFKRCPNKRVSKSISKSMFSPQTKGRQPHKRHIASASAQEQTLCFKNQKQAPWQTLITLPSANIVLQKSNQHQRKSKQTTRYKTQNTLPSKYCASKIKLI